MPTSSARSVSVQSERDLGLAVLVVRLTDQVKQAIREIGEELGLTVAQLDVLRQLYSHGPTPMSRLAEILNCEASNLTGLIDRLEVRGLVERQADPADRRVRLLALTGEGNQASLDAWLAVAARCRFAKLPDDRRSALEALLSEALEETAGSR